MYFFDLTNSLPMPVLTFVNRMNHMDLLIRTRSTGTPLQFARKIGISRRALFLWLDQLREDFGFPIEYDKAAQTYYYTKPGRFSFGFHSLPELMFKAKIAEAEEC
jgi:predicted DNA-binding transcriptional regulator YafY